MSVRSGQSVSTVFTTSSFSTGALANADSLPTGTLYLNGVANAATVTVTNIATGVYRAAVTLPTLAVNDVVNLVILATVGGVAGGGKVWEDTKDVFAGAIPDVAAGASNGLLVAGSNAATTLASLTVTGAFTVSGGTAFTNGAGTAFLVQSTGGDGHGFAAGGFGTGDGIRAVGAVGGSGRGMYLTGSATAEALYLDGDPSIDGLFIKGQLSVQGSTNLSTVSINAGHSGDAGLTIQGFNAAGLVIQGNGTGAGMLCTGGATGAGMELAGGATSGLGLSVSGGAAISNSAGAGLTCQSTQVGSAGLLCSGMGAGGAGIAASGTIGATGMIVQGNGAGDGLHAIGGIGGGVDIRGNITGNLSGSVGSLTTNNDKTGYSLTVTPPTAAQVATAVLTTAMTESYAVNGVAPTLAQIAFMTYSAVQNFRVAGTAISEYKLDGTTVWATVTTDDAVSPTSRVRSA